MKTLFLLNPRGPCAGVHRAIAILQQSIEKYGTPIYVNHEIVHNDFVIAEFEKKGVVFCKSPHQVPENAPYIFSAHGVSPHLRESALQRNLITIDATCPLVEKVHNEVSFYLKNEYTVIYIGKENHPESNGIRDIGAMIFITNAEEVDTIELPHQEKIAVLTQTTLSVSETDEIITLLKNKFPQLITPKKQDICYATQNRQDAVKKAVQKSSLLLVIGSKKSSNSNKLVETGTKEGIPSFLIPSEKDLPWDAIKKAECIALTSGASVPEKITQQIIQKIQLEYPEIKLQHQNAEPENMTFPLPQI